MHGAFNSQLDKNNPGCELVAGNQCPTVCGGRWKEWRSGWELAPSISVTCKGTLRKNNSHSTLAKYISCYIANTLLNFDFFLLPQNYSVNTDHCNNNVTDSDETDFDCGGVSCDACTNGG